MEHLKPNLTTFNIFNIDNKKCQFIFSKYTIFPKLIWNKIRDLFRVKLYIIRSETKKRERERERKKRERESEN